MYLVSLVKELSQSHLVDFKVVSLCFCWYAISSLTSQLTKQILEQFDFPVFVGEFQFLCSLVLGYTAIVLSDRFPILREQLPGSSVATTRFVFNRRLLKLYFPMGTFQFIAKLFSLAATAICPIATVASIRALGPLFIVFSYRLYYKVRFPSTTYLSLVPLLVGVVIIVVSQSGDKETTRRTISDPQLSSQGQREQDLVRRMLSENSDYLKGIAYSFTATIIFAGQSIYAKNVVTNAPIKDPGSLALSKEYSHHDIEKYPSSPPPTTDSKKPTDYDLLLDKPDKLTTLIYCATYGMMYSIPAFMTYEFKELFFGFTIVSETVAEPNLHLVPWTLLVLNGISHFSQSLIAFHILAILPTVTYSIAAMMKRIVIITISMIMIRKSLSFLEVLGLLHVAVGLYCYDRWGSKR
ncbi:hypothetical protein OGAPHI_004795 [Ogataea philodendri]|uniref:Sugar phosphate transporter domain-containing protein n=1 Tax=Ogataea philodendri TaxID=1378263 RepID=A0A9P8T2W2_9ASCO|nr:uncharacterized protein OGAPHI_004795 [Ogataea philodendri]KAH3664081.1 hypothetical protein OGAPHI_004795 [Ogataea philodendri]